MQVLNVAKQNQKKSWQIIIDKFKGTATVLDDAILGAQYAKEAINLIQVQDGRWKNRWGRAYYGMEIPGESGILGAGTFIREDGTMELIAIGETTGKGYKSVNGGAWTEITGATFDLTGTDLFFKQINSYLFVCNGVDYLTRYDGTEFSRYTKIDTPTNVAGTRGSGLNTGSNNNFYQVTAVNNVGETMGSVEINVTTDKVRDVWNPTNNEFIDLSWDAVTGADKYQVYYSDLSGSEELLAVADTNSYKDDNSATVNIYSAVPTQDFTGAPKFSMIATSGSRIWGIAPKEFPWTVFFSGTGQQLGKFSYAFGGGSQPLDPGSEEKVAYVEHYRTGKGDTAVTVFTQSPKGTGSVWQVQLVQQQYTDPSDGSIYTYIQPNPDKIVGSVGTNAPGAALLVGDTIMFLSGRGIYALESKPNIPNVLSTIPESENIRPSYFSLNFSKSHQFRAYAYQNFILFSATESGGENDIIFIYDTDLDRWYWKWTFGVRQFLEYTDTDGNTKFLMVPTSGNQMVECSENISGDFGQAIKTSLITGLIPIDRDQSKFAKVLQTMVVLSRPKGTINFEVLGLEKKSGFSSIATKTITGNLQVAELWSGSLGEILLNDSEDAPTTYNQASVKKIQNIRKSLNAIQFHLYSNTADTEYTLTAIQANGFIDPTRAPSNWMN